MRADAILKAYFAIMTLMETELPPRDAQMLLALKDRLQTEAAKFTASEKALADKYANKDGSGNMQLDAQGRFRIDGEEKVREYLEERDRLAGEETEINMPKIVLHAPRIRPAVMETLGEFINFL